MIKNNKYKMIISSFLILLPIILDIMIYDRLPDKIPIHWNIHGDVDGWGSPLMLIALPMFLFILHWICIFATAKDNSDKNQNKKVFGMVFWISPAISILTNCFIYATIFDIKIDVISVLFIIIGISFIAIGNYMPKCRQNRTIGIKIKWTLENEENWNRTHRLFGKISVIIGFLCIPSAFLPTSVSSYIIIAMLAVLVVVPMLYSYLYHRKQLRKGEQDENNRDKKSD